MVENEEHLIDQIRQVAEGFIKKHYVEEEHLFLTVWEAFEKWVKQLKTPIERIVLADALRTQVGLGFVGEEGLDLVSPIVLSTVAETLQESRKRKLSVSDLERIVGKAATRAGAVGELLACLIRHLPELVTAARNAKTDVSEAYVSLAKKPQYEIWTNGKHKIIDSIDKFKQKQEKYLFWIDLTNNEYLSLGRKPEKKIGPTAIRLLIFLTNNIGISVPRREVFEDVLQETTEIDTKWKNRLHQYITQLQNFSAEDLRKLYLVHDRTDDTLSLKKSFKDKYFIFRVLRAPQK